MDPTKELEKNAKTIEETEAEIKDVKARIKELEKIEPQDEKTEKSIQRLEDEKKRLEEKEKQLRDERNILWELLKNEKKEKGPIATPIEQDTIKLDTGMIAYNVQGVVKEHLVKSIQIAERFLNLEAARDVFEAYGTERKVLRDNAKQVRFSFEPSPPGTEGPLAWILKDDPFQVYLNDIFSTRLVRLSTKASSSKEVIVIVFAMAMSIVHEFGHLSLQWQTSNATTPLAGVEASPPSNSKRPRLPKVHTTPDLFKEAGRYVERKLFFEKTLALICKIPSRNQLKWNPDKDIIGVALDNCPHDRYICDKCTVDKVDKETCKKNGHVIPDCEQCNVETRYKMISARYIDQVYNFTTQMSDQQLLDQKLIETDKSLKWNHVAYSIKYAGPRATENDLDDNSDLVYFSICGTK